MIEAIVFNYLSGVLDVPVVTERPASAPTKYVFFEKTGGGERNHIKSATLAVQSYGSSLYEAASLNEAVKEAMDLLPTLDTISSCKLNSDYNYTDATTKRYRYQAVFDIIY